MFGGATTKDRKKSTTKKAEDPAAGAPETMISRAETRHAEEAAAR